MDEDNLPIPENASELEFLEQESKQNIFIESEDLPINEEVLKQQVAARQLGYGDDELKIIEGTAFKEVMDDMDAKGINYSNVDIYSYIPESERLTPYLIFMEDVRNRWYTDEFVEYLVKISASGAFKNIGYNDLPFSPAAQIHEHALNISFRRGPDNFNNMLLIAIDADNPRGGFNPKKMEIKYINNIFPGGSYKATLEEQNRRFWEEKGMTPEGKWLPEVAERGIIRIVDADGNVTYENFKGEPIPADDPRLEQYKFDDMTAKLEAEAYNKAEGPEKLKMMRDKNIITEYEYQELLKGNDPFTPEPDTPKNVVDEVSELQDALRNKYKNELDELNIIKRPFYDPYKEINTNGIFIESIVIKPEFRGGGTGSKIIEEIQQFATENNLGIELEPDRQGGNQVRRFWENRGFVLQEYFDEAGNLITDNKELNNVYKWVPYNTDNRPFGPGAAYIDEILNANTQLVDELPLSQTVKNQFDNFLRTRARNLATPGGAIDAVDIWELAVTGLMITTIALSEIDEIPTIFKRTATNMFNSMTAPYNIPPVPLEEYDLNYEFINKVLTTGEKVMPTDIIIKKVGDVVKGAAETGAVTGFGYVPPNLTKTDTMETTQKIQPGVQEEKMFEQAKPKKSKATGGAGVKIL
mgnify:FL=1